MKKLTRSPSDKYVAGVCGGLAAYLGLDANLVRVAMVVAGLLLPFGTAAYLLLWLALPLGVDGPTGFDSLRSQLGR